MSTQDTTRPIAKGAEPLAGAPENLPEGKVQPAKVGDRSTLLSTPGYYKRAWRSLRRDRVAMSSLVLSVLLVIFSFGAPVISALTGNDYATGDLTNFLTPWFTTLEHPLGTDPNGRDVLVRLAYGGRVSMTVALVALAVALLVGLTMGAVAGFYGGLIDSVIMRFVDVLISIPSIAVLLLISVWIRPGPVGLAVIIALLGWTGLARLIRGEVLSLRSRDYVDAARVSGASNRTIITRHIFPNVISLVIVWASLALPGLIITEATLSYLGFGVRIPTPSWGNMLQEAYQFITLSWTYAFLPGLFIFLAALSFNLLGIGLRDALDPRLNN
ncbi:MAG: ABC transporter permease [Chloroflexia bacterium]|nr:ABC transporter permease [Chloroflexia bacterium]